MNKKDRGLRFATSVFFAISSLCAASGNAEDSFERLLAAREHSSLYDPIVIGPSAPAKVASDARVGYWSADFSVLPEASDAGVLPVIFMQQAESSSSGLGNGRPGMGLYHH